MNVEEFFLKLRFDKAHHLGLGDIRLTLGQQDEVIAAFRELELAAALHKNAASQLGDMVADAHNDHPLRHFDRTCPACNAAGEANQTKENE